MGNFLGGGSSANSPSTIAQLRVQNAQYGIPIPAVYGQARVAGNVVWAGAFTQITNSHASGKGAGNTTTTYSYTCAAIFALSLGPIESIIAHWNDGAYHGYRTQAEMLAGGWVLNLGEPGQAIWPFLINKHPAFQIGYSNIAIACNSSIQLGATPSLPQFNWEIAGFLQYGGAYGLLDALPSQIILDIINNQLYGLGLSVAGSNVEAYTTTPTDFDDYCLASNSLISPVLDSQDTAADWIRQFLDIAHGDVVWSEGLLKFTPYYDDDVSGNGINFTPYLTPAYTITLDDLVLDGSDDSPVIVQRKSPTDRYNIVDVEYENRSANYKTQVAEATSMGDTYFGSNLITAYSMKREPSRSYHPIKQPGLAAWVANLKLLYILTVRNTYQFKLPQNYLLLDPLDLLYLNIPECGLPVNTLVRITSITERDDGVLQIEAEDFGNNSTPGYPAQSNNGTVLINNNVAPASVNNPIILEPTSEMVGGIPYLWIALSGQNANQNWGGCHIYYSEDGGNTYNLLGEVTIPAAMGSLLTDLNAYGGTNPDTINTMEVDLSQSGGELFSIAQALAAEGNNLCWVGNGTDNFEFLSFDLADPGANPYQYVMGAGGAPDWAASFAYSEYAVILPTTGNAGNYLFIASIAGTSGGSAPTWPQTVGDTVTDNSVVWENIGSAGNLYRNLFGSNPNQVSWGAGIFWAYLGVVGNLDGGVFAWQYPTRLVGVNLQFKFTSFNAANSNEQDLSSVSAYGYTPLGIAYSGPSVSQAALPTAFGYGPAWAASTDYIQTSVIVDSNGNAEFAGVATNVDWNFSSPTAGHPGICLLDYNLSGSIPAGVGVLSASQAWLVQAIELTPAVAGVYPFSIGSGIGSDNAGGSSQVVAVPSSYQAGDILIAQIVGESNSLTGITPPTGWTPIVTYAPGLNVRCDLLYKIAAASEPASYTFALPYSAANNGQMAGFRGASGVPGFIFGSSGTSTTPSYAGAITGTIGNQLLTFVSWASNAVLTVGAESGSTTPSWSLTVGRTTADGSIIWENIGTLVPYGTWKTVTSTSVTIARAKDPIHITFDLSDSYNNRQNRDQVFWQLLVNGREVTKGQLSLISGPAETVQDLRAIFAHNVTGNTGTVTVAVQVQAINGSGSGSFQFVCINPVLSVTPQVQRSVSGSTT